MNHVKENDLVHGEFMDWVNRIGIEYKEAQRFMKVANELPNRDTWSNLGSRALYLIASLPEEERQKEHVTPKGEVKTSKLLNELLIYVGMNEVTICNAVDHSYY